MKIVGFHKTEDEPIMKKIYRVAVYGTLLRGLSNHSLLENATFVGSFWTEPIYQMYATSGDSFPYIIKGGSTSIYMEVFEFTKSDLDQRLDHLEGVNNPPTNHDLYRKEQIYTPFGLATVYERLSKMYIKNKPVIGGNWIEYKKHGNKGHNTDDIIKQLIKHG